MKSYKARLLSTAVIGVGMALGGAGAASLAGTAYAACKPAACACNPCQPCPCKPACGACNPCNPLQALPAAPAILASLPAAPATRASLPVAPATPASPRATNARPGSGRLSGRPCFSGLRRRQAPRPFQAASRTACASGSRSSCSASLKRLNAPQSAIRQVSSTICSSLKCAFSRSKIPSRMPPARSLT